jgi:hypothetical protein
MRNPEDFFNSMINRKRIITVITKIAFQSVATATLYGFNTITFRTLWIMFFLPFRP